MKWDNGETRALNSVVMQMVCHARYTLLNKLSPSLCIAQLTSVPMSSMNSTTSRSIRMLLLTLSFAYRLSAHVTMRHKRNASLMLAIKVDGDLSCAPCWPRREIERECADK